MAEYKPRIVDKILEFKLKSKGAVLIEGPKWCGKTTTGMQLSNSILQVDNPSQMKKYIILSETNPQILLEGQTPRLVDEWQLLPNLWDTARHEIDSRHKKGQFIFTGSAVPINTSKILHSGTGRFSWLNMRTMSLYESGESNGQVSLKNLFKKTDNIDGYNKMDINQLAYIICRGGWPETINEEPDIALEQAFDYYDAVVKSDINRADGVEKNESRVRKLMQSYARNQGSQATNETIKSDILTNDSLQINERTIASYINSLKNIFVIEDMPAWNPNLRSKTAIRTSNTRYYSDPSIATAALGIGPKDLIEDINTMGLLFETLCVRDLRIYAQSINGNVYHYRDSNGLECDSVIHLRDGNYGLVEIKLGGDTLINEGSKNLLKLSNKINTKKMMKPSFLMVVVGLGDYAYKRQDGVLVVPINCLKN